jgi:uncharacterized membrane protein YgaE (UPF0421/DUF939 family)
MSPIFWVMSLLICALVAASVTWVVMRSRQQVLLAKQREDLAALRATLTAEKQALENSLKMAEEATRRRAMDEFLADIRVEERHYTREHRVLFMTRKMLVRQERIFFRNIPLSSWIEHEMPIEEGVDPEEMARAMSIFANAALGDIPGIAVTRLLR